ncbi:MAG: glutamate--tRNA ligase [Rhodothalassiaceae bacterium]
MAVRVRFAPSPTGYLHVGNARAAIHNWLFARQQGGHMLLRLDDTDQERSEKRYVDGIRRDLTWLGLDWDSEIRQSDRVSLYQQAVETLKAAGRLYPCYETPEELDIKRKLQRAQGRPPVYDRAALALTEAEKAEHDAQGRRPHWRFLLDRDAPVAFDDLVRGAVTLDPASVSDPILIREDDSYLYTLPSVVDDLDQAISHVIRGEDHVTNSAVQVQLYEALGGRAPAFAHVSLLTAAGGQVFSKREGGFGSLAGLRAAGLEPMAVMSFLARLGSSRNIEPYPRPQPLIEQFDFADFGKAPAKVDLGELETLNARIVHQLDYHQVQQRPELDGISQALFETARPNLAKLADLAEWRAIVEGPVTPVIADEDRDFVAQARDHLPAGALTGDSWAAWTTDLKSATGRKGKALFMPLRLALTGQRHGPELAALLPLIGRDRAIRRLSGEAA